MAGFVGCAGGPHPLDAQGGFSPAGGDITHLEGMHIQPRSAQATVVDGICLKMSNFALILGDPFCRNALPGLMLFFERVSAQQRDAPEYESLDQQCVAPWKR